MPRPKGSKNKKTLEREAADRVKQASLVPPVPFSESAAREVAGQSEPATDWSQSPVPSAPASPDAEYIEYLASNGDRWRIELGKELLTAFGLTAGEVTKFHEALSPQQGAWNVLRLHYGIAPLVGETKPEYLRPHSLETIAESLSVEPGAVQAQIEAAKDFWIRWRMANKGQIEPPAMEPSVPEDEASALLQKYGFHGVTDPDHRRYAAGRLRDFKHKLEDDEAGSMPVQAIRLELEMARQDKIIDKLAQTAETSADDLRNMQTWMDMRSKTAAQHLNVMKALDATQAQNPSVARKVAFIDCLGTLVKAVEEYEARGDRSLIDGVHDAGDIEFLVTPTSLRPAQYRPDMVAIINDAMRHDNLFNPDYVPPTLERRAHRRLLKGMQEGARAMMAEQGGLPEMEDEESSAAISDDVRAGSGLAEPMGSGAQAHPGSPGAMAGQTLGSSRRISRQAGNEFVSG